MLISYLENMIEKHCGGTFETIRMRYLDFNKYPYLDTFFYADFKRSLLSKKPGRGFKNIRTKNGNIESSEFGGEIFKSVPSDMDESDFEYSEIYGGYIPSDESVYVNYKK